MRSMSDNIERLTIGGLDRRVRRVETQLAHLQDLLQKSLLHMSELEQLEFIYHDFSALAFHQMYFYYAQLKDIPRQYMNELRDKMPETEEEWQKIYKQYRVMAKMKQ